MVLLGWGMGEGYRGDVDYSTFQTLGFKPRGCMALTLFYNLPPYRSWNTGSQIMYVSITAFPKALCDEAASCTILSSGENVLLDMVDMHFVVSVIC